MSEPFPIDLPLSAGNGLKTSIPPFLCEEGGMCGVGKTP